MAKKIDCSKENLSKKQKKLCNKQRSERRRTMRFILLFSIVGIIIFSTIAIALYTPTSRREVAIILGGDGDYEIELTQEVIVISQTTPSSSFLPSASQSLGVRYNQTFESGDPNISDVSLGTGSSYNTNSTFVWEGNRSVKIENDDNTTTNGWFQMTPLTTFYANETIDLSLYYFTKYNETVNNIPFFYMVVIVQAYDNSTGDSLGTDSGQCLIAFDLIGNRGYNAIGSVLGTHGEKEYYVNYTSYIHENKWGAVSIPDIRSLCVRAVENNTIPTYFNTTSNIEVQGLIFYTGNEQAVVGENTISYIDLFTLTSKPASYTQGENWYLDSSGGLVTHYQIQTSYTAKLLNSSFDLTNSIINDDFIISIYDYLDLSALEPSEETLFTNDLDYFDFINLKGSVVIGGTTIQGQSASSISGSILSPLIPLQIDSQLGNRLQYEFEAEFQADGQLITNDFAHGESDRLDINSQDFSVTLQEFLQIT
jgi:hypothetical protein